MPTKYAELIDLILRVFVSMEKLAQLNKRIIDQLEKQTHDVLLPDAPDSQAIELLRKLKNEDDTGLDYISEETWEEIDAVLRLPDRR